MQRLDVSGLIPPAPILEVRRALARLPEGAVLEVTGDDPELVHDLPAYCAQAGHELRMVRPGTGNAVVFEIARGESDAGSLSGLTGLARTA